MGDKDKVKALRNENEQVKRQLEELKKEFESIKSRWRNKEIAAQQP